jgi:hypothetical protein
MNAKRILVPVSIIAAAFSASGQVIVDEQFNYVDQAALNVNWTQGAGLTLSTGVGNPAPGAVNAGTATAANLWAGSTFSLTPTDENNVRLTADIFSSGNANQANTIGLRAAGGGANPLFEMGMYRLFDNIQTGPDTTTTTATTDGIGVRTINVGTDLPGQDWVKMGVNYTGWSRFEATFDLNSVTTRIDLGADGTWDLSYTENGTAPLLAFGQLRVHSPAISTGGSATVDNIKLEVVAVPEPSTYALLAAGAALFGALSRRRK